MSRKFKLLIFLFVCLIALLPIRVEAAETTNVKDYLNYLSETEVQELQSRINEISSKYSLDTVVVITDNTDGKSSMQYADDFYDNNNYGLGSEKSGVLMLINMNAREIWISTKGTAITIFTDSIIKTMVNDITRYLSNGNYTGASSEFLKKVDYYCNKKLMSNNTDSNSTESVPPKLNPNSVGNSGSKSRSSGNSSSKPSSDTEVSPSPTSYISRLKDRVTSTSTYVISLIISMVATLIVTENSKWKVTVNNRTYEGYGSFNLTDQQDILVGENTTRIIKKKSNENSSVKSDRSASKTYKSNSGRSRRNDSTTYRNNNGNSSRNDSATYRSNNESSSRNDSTTHRSSSGSTHGGGGGSF